MTNRSTGSTSPERSFANDTGSPASSDSTPSEDWHMRSPDVDTQVPPSYPYDQRAKPGQEDTTKESLRFLGRVAGMSQSTKTGDLDWALIHLECEDIFSCIEPSLKHTALQGVVHALSGTKMVQVCTPSNTAMHGKITGTSTYMQMPHSIAFQEMWTVKFDGPLCK